MLSDDEITLLTPTERAEMIRRLVVADRVGLASAAQHPRKAFLSLLAVAAVVLAGWLILLAATLPRTYVVDRWDSVWTGFDAALLAAIVATTWAAWQRRQFLLIAFAIICATLVVCDAWFDVMTAAPGRDQALSIASALLVELPFAAVLIYVARSLLRLINHRMRYLAGASGPDPRLYEVRFFGLDP